jgi:hypothetical protein
MVQDAVGVVPLVGEQGLRAVLPRERDGLGAVVDLATGKDEA